MSHQSSGSDRVHPRSLLGVLPGLVFLVLALLAAPPVEGKEKKEGAVDHCVKCHSNPRFLVTNKKLYDYFQQWDLSIHKQEDVACVDCHGGNPETSDKKKAHGDGVGAADEGSGIYFANVVDTCGECHEEILEGFHQSNHFEHMLASEEEAQGPTCVTCHGSINVAILNVNSVEEACARCHNAETENNPDIPEKARSILNRFLSMHRFYRYIAIRAEPLEARQFFHDVDPSLHELSVTWHTFDLEAIDEQTTKVLDLLKTKRDAVRARVKRQAAGQEED